MGTGKKRKGKKKKAKSAPANAGGSGDNGVAAQAAAKYLEQWALQQQTGTAETLVWKFNKTRQSFLLRAWPHRNRVSSATFKIFVGGYAQSLPVSCAERTLAQAKEVAAAAEASEASLLEQLATAPVVSEAENGDRDGGGQGNDADGTEAPSGPLSAAEIEEQRALLKIKRARALRIVQALSSEPASKN
jgi:hypothetical protein